MEWLGAHVLAEALRADHLEPYYSQWCHLLSTSYRTIIARTLAQSAFPFAALQELDAAGPGLCVVEAYLDLWERAMTMGSTESMTLLVERMDANTRDRAFYRAADRACLAAVQIMAAKVSPLETNQQAHPLQAAIEHDRFNPQRHAVGIWLRDHWYLPTHPHTQHLVDAARGL